MDGMRIYTPISEAGYDPKEDTHNKGATIRGREGIDTALKLTVAHILDSGDLPRIERLIKCLC